MEDKKSTKKEFDSLMREAKDYKWVVLLEDGEAVIFIKEDIEEELNSKGEFIKLGDVIVNKNSIMGVVTMDIYLSRDKTDEGVPTLSDLM